MNADIAKEINDIIEYQKKSTGFNLDTSSLPSRLKTIFGNPGIVDRDLFSLILWLLKNQISMINRVGSPKIKESTHERSTSKLRKHA
jgi:hypothetical protein